MKKIYFAGTGNETEYSLWKPMGVREVIDFTPVNGNPPQLPPGAWLVGSEEGFADRFHRTAPEWCTASRDAIFWEGRLAAFASREPGRWYVIASGQGK